MSKGSIAGADPGFQVRGAHLKNCTERREARIFGIFRVKNHDFTPKNYIFSNFRGCAPDARRMRPQDPPLYWVNYQLHRDYYGYIYTGGGESIMISETLIFDICLEILTLG